MEEIVSMVEYPRNSGTMVIATRHGMYETYFTNGSGWSIRKMKFVDIYGNAVIPDWESK